MTRRGTRWRLCFLLVLAGLLAAAAVRTEQGSASAGFWWSRLRGGYTVEDRLAMHGSAVEARLREKFVVAALPYPPARLAYVAFKDQAVLEVYGRQNEAHPWKHVLTYPILGMSGDPGPKLREGDLQVPEGIYRAEFLNPNSRFHVSIRLNYPNDFDVAQGRADGRSELGSDIMIHGTTSSIGCLAMGNQAAEDLFVLAALAGKEHVCIVVAPTDFRRSTVQVPKGGPSWVKDLYHAIEVALRPFPRDSRPADRTE